MDEDERAREQLLARREIAGDCWLYTGSRKPNGYGQLTYRGRTNGAHRVAYRVFVGPIPGTMEVHHTCGRRACFNPAHLELMTHAENASRVGANHRNKRKTHCPHGHEYTEQNTRVVVRSNGRTERQCRACARGRYAASRPLSE
jgi:hypothetical protein